MMKHLHQILALVACAAMASGCARESMLGSGSVNGRIPMNIDGSIRQVQTKATDSGFSDRDAIGLFAVNYSDENTVAGTLEKSGNQADNAKYIYYQEDLRWKSTRAVYYKDANTNADLYLYYPYQDDIDDINAYGFEIQADQNVATNGARKSGYEMSDFLWGKAANVSPTESKVPVLMNHMMSSASVTLVEGSGFAEGEWDELAKNVVVTNTTLKAVIDFATGVVSPVGEPQQKGIVMPVQEDGSFRAIVVPQEVAAGTPVFAITLGTSSYKFKLDDVTNYVSGKVTTFEITANKKTASGEYELALSNSQITDWFQDNAEHGGEARQYFVVNVEERGTLGREIAKAKKNPDRIKNLKITGKIDGHDFMFMRDSMKILEAVNLKECRTYGPVSEDQSIYYSDRWQDEWNNLERYIQENGQPDYQYRDNEGYMCYYWYKTKDWDVIPVNAFKDKKSLCYFVFPEGTKRICNNAFYHTGLSGALIIPDDVTEIGISAFSSTNVSSVTFGDNLKSIGDSAFSGCTFLSGEILLPESLISIGSYCFNGCKFTGRLMLPEDLETIREGAFSSSGSYYGDLEIPERLYELPSHAFSYCTFTGSLNLNNVTSIGYSCFNGCDFKGELVLPEGITEIEDWAFANNLFSTVSFPSTLKRIGSYALCSNPRLTCDLVFPEELIAIGEFAFAYAGGITSLVFPSTLQTIQSRAFANCVDVSRIVCSAVDPPIVQPTAFEGIAKDNFTLEVPAQSVKRYQSETTWSDFKRISAYHNFSISRNLMRGLNAQLSRTYVLRADSGASWSLKSKPEWVTVSPENGVGKMDVTITLSEMDRTAEQFSYEERYEWGINTNYACGRAGEVVFELDGKEYTTSITVQQFDCDYGDEYVKEFQTASKGAGIDIVFLGDGYDARDIANGKFLQDAEEGFGHFFDVEPYKTYKEYFNVYAVVAMSDDSGIGTVNTIKDVRFGTYFTQNRLMPCDDVSMCFDWSKKANPLAVPSKTLTIMLLNSSTYEGITMMNYDNYAIATCPVSREPYPYDFRGIIQHEAGGHGFGKLGDEYIYHNAFIQTCTCCCCEHPGSDDDLNSFFGVAKFFGWFKNLSMKSNSSEVPWAHLIYNPDYSDYVDMYEGGYMHSRGMFRSEATSCMNNNIPYFSAISRQAIVENIKKCAGETFSLEEFYANDDDSFGPTTKGAVVDRTFGVDPKFVRATGRAPIIVNKIIK